MKKASFLVVASLAVVFAAGSAFTTSKLFAPTAGWYAVIKQNPQLPANTVPSSIDEMEITGANLGSTAPSASSTPCANNLNFVCAAHFDGFNTVADQTSLGGRP